MSKEVPTIKCYSCGMRLVDNRQYFLARHIQLNHDCREDYFRDKKVLGFLSGDIGVVGAFHVYKPTDAKKDGIREVRGVNTDGHVFLVHFAPSEEEAHICCATLNGGKHLAEYRRDRRALPAHEPKRSAKRQSKGK